MNLRRTMGIRQYDSPTTATAYIAQPSFGYAVELRLALDIRRFQQNVASFDRGIDFDQRRCTFRIQATEQQIWLLTNILNRERRNEHNKFILTLAEGSGFFPAGADKGDSGEFVFSFLENINFSAMKLNPLGLFDVNFRILIHEYPNIAVLPAKKDLGGKFSFGSVAKLRDPQIRPIQDFSSRRGVTLGGEALTVWTPTDEFLSNLMIRTTTGKMAELARYLQMVRGDEFTVTPGRKYWMWGGQGAEWRGDLGEQVLLLDGNFLMTHTGLDLWTMPVQLWQKVKLTEPAPRPTYSLTIIIHGQGTVRVNGITTTGTTYHHTLDEVTIHAAPAQGFEFIRWEGHPIQNNTNIQRIIMDAESLTIHAWFTGEGGVSRVRVHINPPHGDTLTTIVKINGIAQTPVSAEGIHGFDCAWGDEIEAYTEPHGGYVWRSYLAAINVVPSSQSETFLDQTIRFTALGNSWLYPMTDVYVPTKHWYMDADHSVGQYYIKDDVELAEFSEIVRGVFIYNGTAVSVDTFESKTVTLTSDIDLNAHDNWEPIGEIFNRFHGMFDADGYIIINLKINRTSNNQGLFGYVGNGGKVQKLGLENVNISGGSNTAGICGSLQAAQISDCYVIGDIGGSGSVGSIVGIFSGSGSVLSLIQRCWAIGNITSNGAPQGGLVGTAGGGDISDSAAMHNQVMGSSFTNRVAGRPMTGGNVVNCVAFEGMLNATGTTSWSGKELNGASGEDISAVAINADGTIGGRFTLANGWTTQNGRLPGLRVRVVDRPGYLT